MINLFGYFIGTFIFFFLWTFLKKRNLKSKILFFYHSIWGAFFLLYSLSNPSDIRALFNDNSIRGCVELFEYPLDNSNIVYCSTYVFKRFFIDNYGLLCSIFNFIGFIALNIFFKSFLNLRLKNKFDKYLITCFFFLPSISFWSSINYKDSIVLLAYSLLLDFIITFEKNKISKLKIFKSFIFLVFALMVRPYSFLIILISIFLVLIILFIKDLYKRNINKSIFFIILLSTLLFYPSINIVSNQFSIETEWYKLNSLNLSLLKKRSALNYQYSMNKSSFISNKGFSKLLFDLFGPFSIKSLYYSIESFSGIIFSLIFFRFIFYSVFKKLNFKRPEILFSLFIFCIELLKVHTGVFNVGILVRHRLIIYLMFAFIFISQSKFNEDIKNSKNFSRNLN